MCKELRPDNFISVLSYSLKDLPGGVRNLKFCTDKKVCKKAAIEKSKTRKI